MRQLVVLITLLFCSVFNIEQTAYAQDNYREVKIADPFIELRSGPGRGYPVFYVADREEWIKIIKRKTHWFKVETRQGDQGWVSIDQLLLTLTPEGERTTIKETSEDDFKSRRIEMGILGGDFSNAQVMTLYGAYNFTRNISTELAISQALGNISTKSIISVRLMHQPFPEWKISPFFALGTGNIKTEPHTTLIQAQDRSDTLAHAGIGFKTFLTQHLMLRGEYNKFVVFSSNDYNEDLKEWKVGLAFFY